MTLPPPLSPTPTPLLTGALSVSSDLHLEDVQRRSKVGLQQQSETTVRIRRGRGGGGVGQRSAWPVTHLEQVVEDVTPVRFLVVDQQARRRLSDEFPSVSVSLRQKNDKQRLAVRRSDRSSSDPEVNIWVTHPSAAQTSDSVEHSAQTVRVAQLVDQRDARLQTRG